ncbi:hypothetical protein [Maricaulis sp.]|uniref:hypothetical protein n=1 Tax=Maricaulis sp. TaxID=1486257 RepID=UPI0025C10E16|nr:hypothetical protein [Maricaulis sp.]
MLQARRQVARWTGLAALSAALSASLLATPQTGAEMRLALNANVSTQCAIADIDSESWNDGILRLSAHCNAQSYRVRLMSGETAIGLSAASLTAPGADIRLRSGDAWINQDRPGSRRIEIRIDAPLALTGPVSIRLDTL